MLHEFIAANREAIIARTREKVAARTAPLPTERVMTHGVPLFLDQLSARLRTDPALVGDDLSATASLHGGELLSAGLTIAQVVQDYGSICQAITELAVERDTEIRNDDFRTLNLCLDVAIADAVTEYARQSDQVIIGRGVEQLGALAHELRNFLATATLAFDALRNGNVGATGVTAQLLGKSLVGMTALVSRSLAEVRLEAGPPRDERVGVARLLEDIEISAAMEARAHDIQLLVEAVAGDLAIRGDAQIITSIVTNLVQNACKFTRRHGRVTLRARATDARVFIDVADECGGLPPGKLEELFRPFEQRHADRKGLGLGLAISRRGAEALGGDIAVVDRPGEGCVITVELPRAAAT